LEITMKYIGQGRLAAAVALAAILGMSGVASAQQQTPDNQNQQNAPQQNPSTQPRSGMGHEMMRDGMGKMGDQMHRKGMEGDHGRMGSGMKQDGSAPSRDSTATTGANPSAAPSTGSK
jgi:hypothetical protein